jgi:hypothetical protein
LWSLHFYPPFVFFLWGLELGGRHGIIED